MIVLVTIIGGIAILHGIGELMPEPEAARVRD